MGRAANLAEGLVLDHGTNAHGVRHRLIFEGEVLTLHSSQDMEADLAEVAAMRERNAMRKFGEDKEIGRIPELVYARINLIRDPAERKKAVRRFFVNNPAFCAYAPYLSNSRH